MTRLGRMLALAACVATPLAHALFPATCPESAPDGSKCYGDIDANGAFVLFVVPPRWNGVLVVHGHDGPDLKLPNGERHADDLNRWKGFLGAGYAFADTTY